MRLGRATTITALSLFCACEVPEGKLGELPDASHEHEHDAAMDAGHEHEDGGMHQHDAGSDAGGHAGFGLHARPTNITCVAPDYEPPSADGGVHELMPAKLSETGCFDASDPSKPLAGLIPFELNAALWSDGASKRRWMALPGGTKIKVVADGDFEFPAGTMLVKEFSLGGKRLETRFFARHPEQVETDAGVVESSRWVGYTYQWNAEQTEAFLVPAGATTPFTVDAAQPELGTWQVPNREECMTCHSIAAGRSLGPEIRQFNRDHYYEGTKTTSNQLATLEHIGMFEEPLAPLDTLTKLPNPFDETQDLEARARAYLHINCSFCHRKPGGIGGGPDEFRAGLSLQTMGICDVAPTITAAITDLGMDASKAKILAHMSPADSVMWKRMQARGLRQMPPIGTKKQDVDGLNLISQWINSIAECPAPPPSTP